MLRNKKLSRLLSLIAAFSVLLTAFAGISASAEVTSVANKSFYENFEGYQNEIAVTNTSHPSYNGWETAKIAGTANATVSTSAQDNAKGNVLDVKHTGTNVHILGLTRNPNIEIGTDDIVVSADVYVPAVKDGDKQYVRFFVSRGSGSSNVTGNADWAAYPPYFAPAFGLFFLKDTNAASWSLKKATPKQGTNGITAEAGVSNFTVTADRWYKLDYVYHPITNTVDYYIDGVWVTNSPSGEYTADGKTYTYEIPDHTIGGNLGNIVLAAGATQATAAGETAGKFDEVSARVVSSASSVGYGEVASGSSYINARFDIPVKKDTISDANITVKKLADDDVIFSGEGATVVDASNYTINYKDEGGVGIKFNNPLSTAYERYQVIVEGMTDIFEKEASYTYNCTVKSGIVKKDSLSEDFATGLNGYAAVANNTFVTVSGDANPGALTATRPAGSNKICTIYNTSDTYCDVEVNDSTEYIDVSWDVTATWTGSAYKAWFNILGEDKINAAGLSIEHNKVSLMGYSQSAQLTNQKVDDGIVSGSPTSYKFRYYPKTGVIEAYRGTNQNNLSYVGTGQGAVWNKEVSGDKISSFELAPITPDSVTVIDNIKIESYGSNLESSIVESGSFNETFDNAAVTEEGVTSVSGWFEVTKAGRVTLSQDAEKGLKTAVTTRGSNRIWRYTNDTENPYCNVPINNSVEYVDVSWDMLWETGQTNYKALVNIISADGTGTGHVGISVEEEAVTILKNADATTSYKYTTGITAGEKTSYKFRYYPKTGAMEVYSGTSQNSLSRIITAPANDDLKWTDADGTRILAPSVNPVEVGTTYFDNFSIKAYSIVSPGAKVTALTFENADGKMLAENKAGAKKIKIHLDNAQAAPTVTLDGNAVNGEFANGVYTITLDNMLVGNTTYTLNINGTNYAFTTGDGEFKVSNLRFVNGSDEKVENPLVNGTVYAAVDVVNLSNATETPYLIWAAYNGNQLKSIMFTPITATPGFDETVKGSALNVTDDYTSVKAFIWDGLTTIKPLLNSETLTKAVAED